MRIGVLLGGCGHYDGTDAAEAIFVLLALEKSRERPVLLAPDIPQVRTVDHLSADGIEGESRSVMREAARLSRGTVRALASYRPEDLEAIIIPGGYGPVVNFSVGFAELGKKRSIVPEVERFLTHFLEARKPIGLVSLGEVPIRTLLRQELEPAEPPRDPTSLSLDRERRIVHTQGFTAFNRLEDVRAGIEAMVGEIMKMMSQRAHEERPEGGRS